jgi:1-acyl-sn-glycerol-3-phosphate acyltransferase
VSLWANIRMATRVLLIFPWTFFLFWARLAVEPVPGLSKRSKVRWRSFIFRIWGRGALRIFGMRLRVEGHPPRGDCYLVTNHLSYMDAIVLGATVGCVLVSRHDVEDWPVVGGLGRGMDTVFVNRERLRDTLRVKEELVSRLKDGHSVHMFAESKIGPGDHVLPFKPSLLEPAVQAGMPVSYGAIMYSTPEGTAPASEVVMWGVGVDFMPHLKRLLRTRRTFATVSYGDEPMEGGDRKELAEKLWQAVEGRYKPIV